MPPQTKPAISEIVVDRETVLIQGRCWLDGAVPQEAIELRLTPHAGTLLPDGELDEQERAFLGIGPHDFEVLKIRTDATGGVLLRGSPISEFVNVHATGLAVLPNPAGFGAASGYLGRGIAVQLPQRDLTVYAFSSNHELRGRCVLAGSGAPAAGAGVIATVFATPNAWEYSSSEVDATGAFRLRTPVLQPFKVELSFGSTFRSAGTKLTLAAEDAVFPELGTIVVKPLNFAQVHVVDQDGHPIAAATLVVNGMQLVADSAGLARAPLPEDGGPVSLTVSAWGHATQSENCMLTESATHVVRLRRANRLRVTLTSRSNGRGLPEYAIKGSIADLGDPTQGSIGAPASSDLTAGTVVLWADQSGAINLFGLPIGRAFAVEVIDPFGHVLDQFVVGPFDEQGELTLNLAVSIDPIAFTGLVTDPAGGPLPGIEVGVAAVGGRALYGVTDLSGRFEVREFCGDAVQITAGGGRWVEATHTIAPVQTGQTVRIALEPSRVLSVRIEAPDPAILAAIDVRAHAPGTDSTWRGSRLQDNRWVLHDLPLGIVTVEARSDTAEGRVVVDTRVTNEVLLTVSRRME